MNPSGFVREEFPKLDPPYSGEPSMARPMEGLHDTGPTPFLTKTYELVDDLNTNHMVSWSRGNNSFVIWDSLAFSMNILPRYFKHNNFSSFVRQLNTYGFRKVDPDKWEFAHEGFLRGQRHLLRNIRRRKTSNSQPQTSQQGLESCVVEVGRFGLDAEIDRLRRDKQVLMMELVKLRQQQQNTRAHLIAMEERLSGTEMKQRQMMGFIAKAMQNPVFLQQLIQKKGRRKELEEEICKKRRRPIEHGHGDVDFGVFELGQVGEGRGIGVNLGPNYGYDDISRLNDLELEKLAGEIGGLSGNEEKMEEDHVGRGDKAIDEGFWGNLLNEEIEQQIGLLGGEGEDEEDMGVLVEQIGFLGSSP